MRPRVLECLDRRIDSSLRRGGLSSTGRLECPYRSSRAWPPSGRKMRKQTGRGAKRRGGTSGAKHTGLTPELLASRWTLLLPYRERAIAALHQRYGEFTDAEDLVHEAMLRVVQ